MTPDQRAEYLRTLSHADLRKEDDVVTVPTIPLFKNPRQLAVYMVPIDGTAFYNGNVFMPSDVADVPGFWVGAQLIGLVPAED